MSASLLRQPLRCASGWLLLAALVCCSCSNEGPEVTLGSVTGSVTMDGKPVTGVDVQFISPDGAGGSAPLQEDGTFTIISQHGNGLPVGDYKVAIVLPPPPDPLLAATGKPADGPARKPNVEIPRRYLDTRKSGLSATIKEGENTVPLTLQGKGKPD